MNKKQIVASLLSIADVFDENGNLAEADMLTKVASSLVQKENSNQKRMRKVAYHPNDDAGNFESSQLARDQIMDMGDDDSFNNDPSLPPGYVHCPNPNCKEISTPHMIRLYGGSGCEHCEGGQEDDYTPIDHGTNEDEDDFNHYAPEEDENDYGDPSGGFEYEMPEHPW